MKSVLLVISFLFVSRISYAQCDKPFECKSEKASFVAPGGEVTDIEATATVKVEKDKITLTITIQGIEASFVSKIDATEKCEWKDPFKEGISVYKVTTDKGAVQEKNVIKIIGKEGKLKCYFGSDPDDKGGLELLVKETKQL